MVGIRPLVAAPGLHTPDLGVFTDIRLTGGFDDTPYTSSFPNPLITAEAQALEASSQYALHEYDTDAVGPNAAAVLAPGRRPFSVRKPDKMIDVNMFYYLRTSKQRRDTAKQQDGTLTWTL